MLPADTSIGHVHLGVADLTAAARFHEGILGFHAAPAQQGGVALSARGDAAPLVVLSEQRGGSRRRTAGLYHFAVLLPSRRDLARVLRHLIEREAPIEGASDHGVSEAVYLHDVEGNGIEIYADRPRERWTFRGGRLAMPTKALDVEDLLAQDDRPWEGMPAGTRVGHIHLRVADLARSEQFYAGLLGFEVIVRGYPGALFLSAGGYHHHIGLNIWAGTGLPPADPSAPGLRHFSVIIPEAGARDAAIGRLRDGGVPLEEIGEGPVVGAVARDPDGIGVLIAS